MSEPSVEDIVARCETYQYSLSRDEQRALIASWRERSEALKPFAKLAGVLVDEGADLAIGLTNDDFVRARAALQGQAVTPSDYEMIEQGYDPPPSRNTATIEEIVARFERTATMSVEDTVHLIASWRERGELLREAHEALSDEYGKTDIYARIGAALKAKP